MSEEIKDGDLVLPKWFIRVAVALWGIIALGLVPVIGVGIWMVVQIHVLNARLETINGTTSGFIQHVSHPDLHKAGFQVIDAKLAAQEARIAGIEGAISDIQKEIHR